MKIISDLGIQIPQIYLPKPGTDLTKWAVIACDQFTSQPEYWNDVEKVVGNAPSTLNLTFPEVYLEKSGGEERIRNIQSNMRSYMDEGLLQPRDGLIYVERTVDGKTRKGIVLALDLEAYDYNKGSSSLIRATEGTIVDRLPPRMKIREGAMFELPHILVLIDDPDRTVIEPLAAAKSELETLYDFENQVVEALRALASQETFAAKYGIDRDQPVLLFAMGDGNHSLATAKAIWEKMKPHVGMDHPARYALVEVENVHDNGLIFEPIHRVLFGVQGDWQAALRDHFESKVRIEPAQDAAAMMAAVRSQPGGHQSFGVVSGQGTWVVSVAQPP